MGTASNVLFHRACWCKTEFHRIKGLGLSSREKVPREGEAVVSKACAAKINDEGLPSYEMRVRVCMYLCKHICMYLCILIHVFIFPYFLLFLFPQVCQSKLGEEKFDAVYDMNAREVADTKAVADVFKGKVDHYVFMSSAGVYLKSELMPHREVRSFVELLVLL